MEGDGSTSDNIAGIFTNYSISSPAIVAQNLADDGIALLVADGNLTVVDDAVTAGSFVGAVETAAAATLLVTNATTIIDVNDAALIASVLNKFTLSGGVPGQIVYVVNSVTADEITVTAGSSEILISGGTMATFVNVNGTWYGQP
jgi:hypothetical protein